jgi:hypothetical protein
MWTMWWLGVYGPISGETEVLGFAAACLKATSGKGAPWTSTGVAEWSRPKG